MVLVLRVAAEETWRMLKLSWTYADPRIEHLPMVKSPLPVVGILIAYFYFVLSLGPKLMKNRKPFDLRKVMVIYNAAQVVWCAYLFYTCLRLGWGGSWSWICQPYQFSSEPYDYEVGRGVYLYFILKIVDLLDTVFMVLRKSYRQISFLHLYHHAGMVFVIWVGVKAIPTGHHTFVGFINCGVHCLLYTYYLISLFEPRVKSVWWKKYLTLVQIVQFGMNMVHESLPLIMPSCPVDKRVSGILVIQNFFMFALFTDFYLKNYGKSKLS